MLSAAPATETIGSWRLVYPDSPGGLGCLLRHKDASLQIGGYSVALEVQSVDGALVPVMAVRGLAPQPAVGTFVSITVGLRLDQGVWLELPCGQALRCLPDADVLPDLARAFPTARLLRLRLEVTLPTGDALPRPEHEFELNGTKRALQRLKASGVVSTSAPTAPGLDWKGMLQKAWRAVGG
ncbi:MAG: hypothetical protein ACJ8AW_09725 [Rhodopila sp.]